jgi:hypothetical protein
MLSNERSLGELRPQRKLPTTAAKSIPPDNCRTQGQIAFVLLRRSAMLNDWNIWNTWNERLLSRSI